MVELIYSKKIIRNKGISKAPIALPYSRLVILQSRESYRPMEMLAVRTASLYGCMGFLCYVL